MELYQQILLESILRDVASQIQFDADSLVEMKCYQTIQKIHSILSDETLDDPGCFAQIEEIVCVLDALGIGGGGRHDF